MSKYKIPESVLVVIYTSALDVLLLQRADAVGFATGLWQSVTGSKDTWDESWSVAAAREVWEETGIDARDGGPCASGLQDWALENVYAILPQWRHRYAPDVALNTERVFGLRLAQMEPVHLSMEHTDAVWLPWREAAYRCAFASNAEAILHLPHWAA
jgi:dATP pyrophosphohydrolase